MKLHPSSDPASTNAASYVRPVVRSFRLAFVKHAVTWVQGGGHAVVWASERKAFLVVPQPATGNPSDYGRWAAYDLGRRRLRVASSGPFEGFGSVSLKGDDLPIVEAWSIRDGIHENPTRTMSLDCVACGACCRNNTVILDAKDMARLRAGAPQAFVDRVRRTDGHLVLTLLPNGDCAALTHAGTCGVYEARPAACREFPAASECCLFSREEALNIVDGAATGPSLFATSAFSTPGT